MEQTTVGARLYIIIMLPISDIAFFVVRAPHLTGARAHNFENPRTGMSGLRCRRRRR